MLRHAAILTGVLVLLSPALVARADVGTLADSNGEIAAWGYNADGQCNVPAGAD